MTRWQDIIKHELEVCFKNKKCCEGDCEHKKLVLLWKEQIGDKKDGDS